MNEFPTMLKELRVDNNIGQVCLAQKIGVSKGIISLWENGMREPNMQSLIAIADYFGVSIDYLVGREK